MEWTKITNSQFYNGLKTKRNMLVRGKSGWGKTATVEQYVKDHGLKIAYVDMAGQLPESIAGIPAVVQPKIKVTETKDYSKEITAIKKEIKTLNDKMTEMALADTLNEYGKPILNKIVELQNELKVLTDADGKEETYYRRMLDVELKEFLETEGEGWILFFDEINQGSQDSLNTLYGITHPDPTMRRWCGHRISKCQIVACCNLNDGTDGTVYLTELPTPLLNRFFCFELKLSKADATKYLKKKYSNIPRVEKLIKTMLDEDIAPRDVDLALDIIQYNDDGMFLETKLGEALTQKIYEIVKVIDGASPDDLLQNAKEVYALFKEHGQVSFGTAGLITTEEDLINRFKDFLNDEEIASIVKS